MTTHFFYLCLQAFFSLVALCTMYLLLLALFKKDVSSRFVRELIIVGSASSLASSYFGLTYFYTHEALATATILLAQHPLVGVVINLAPQAMFVAPIAMLFLLLLLARLEPTSFLAPNPAVPAVATKSHRYVVVFLTALLLVLEVYLSVALIFL